MITDSDVDRVAEAARTIPPSTESYIEEDYVMNLIASVIDYQQ